MAYNFLNLNKVNMYIRVGGNNSFWLTTYSIILYVDNYWVIFNLCLLLIFMFKEQLANSGKTLVNLSQKFPLQLNCHNLHWISKFRHWSNNSPTKINILKCLQVRSFNVLFLNSVWLIDNILQTIYLTSNIFKIMI